MANDKATVTPEQELAAIEAEILENQQEAELCRAQVEKTRANIAQDVVFLQNDVSNWREEHKSKGVRGCLDFLAKKQLNQTSDKREETLKKFEANLRVLSQRSAELRKKAAQLRIDISERDNIAGTKRAVEALRLFCSKAEELLQLFDELKGCIRAVPGDKFFKHLQTQAQPVEAVVFSSHLKPAALAVMSMYDFISRVMRLTAYGKPLIKPRDIEKYQRDVLVRGSSESDSFSLERKIA